jgi:ATP adenylyltransferase
MTLYCMDNHRTAEQLAEMQQLESAGLCLFCPDGLQRCVGQQVLWQTGHWSVVPNKFPYRGTALHLLLIPREHANDILDLPPASQHDFWNVLAMVRDKFDLKHYGLGIRNGDCRFTGATVAHIHAHVLVGDPTSADEIRMRLSSRPSP